MEFNLSEKIALVDMDSFEAIDIEDVKEFIRRLKEEIRTRMKHKAKTLLIISKIDKLAGDKLNGN